MSWMLVTLLVVLALATAASWHRRVDLRRQQRAIAERAEAAGRKVAAAPIQVPRIDLAKCLGCGTCVTSCPEDGVLQLVHGQAAVVNAGACVGHARCVAECPVGAVTLTQGDLAARDDVPALDESLQAAGTDGLYLVGEITARSLIRNATVQGATVAATIAGRLAGTRAPHGVHDVVIVGAGPGGLACALGCKQHGLGFVLLDQEPVIGGTVAKYPRRKLVLTEPMELPLVGRLKQREYGKEELIELWGRIARQHALPFRGNVRFDRAEKQADGTFVVHTDQGLLRARAVVVAVGRRGVPRRLGVPGEELPHVAYSLLDAAAYTGQQLVVIGGGDTAVEAALALAEQDGNTVTLVYRQDQFFRIRRRNRERLEARLAEGRIEALMNTDVTEIGDTSVDVVQRAAGGDGDADGGVALQLRADAVFVMAGGDAPFAQLAKSGVSFDPADRPAPPQPAADEAAGSGLLPALVAALLATAAVTGWVLWHHDYYLLSSAARAALPKHALLRPDRQLGLWFGLFAAVAVLLNLAYLLRRQQWLGVRFGSLSAWMTTHVGTGLVAVLLTLVHAAMSPRQTAGGWAFWALVALLVTGAIGRWFYAWLPRNTNGRELRLEALRQQLAAATAAIGDSEFGRTARAEVDALIERRQWRASWPGRVLALVGLQWDLARTLRRVRQQGRTAGVSQDALAAVVECTRTAHGAAVALAHFEDLRALMGTWRWLHRWLALFMVLILAVHVATAVLRGVFTTGGLW
ncbi:MAG: NAD(P)-binding domain-containing protein [Planctomycetes bacterium]|nr:NAD(P)-binding domain-containing protein [Planctomycetota bacterium]